MQDDDEFTHKIRGEPLPGSPEAERKAANLEAWLKERVHIAEVAGAEMFLGTPDLWYVDPHWACIAGHVSTHYLKSHYGSLCLGCGRPLYFIPYMTEPELVDILDARDIRPGVT